MNFDSLIALEKSENGDPPTKAARVETPESQYFKDGKRLVDYVLAYEEDEDDNEGSEYDDCESSSSKTRKLKKSDKRKNFQDNLRCLKGLEWEHASTTHSRTKFVLIHAPFKVLKEQAELMRIKMPVKPSDIKKTVGTDGLLNRFLKKFTFLDFNKEIKERAEIQDYFTQPFMQQHLNSFMDHDDEENFFPRIERSRMVYDILARTPYDREESTKLLKNRQSFFVGIQRLLNNRTYTAAFPLHEEIEYYPTKEKPINLSTCSDRQFLYETWAKVKNFYKYQPLHIIQKYFGTRVGFYFSWLGYYTRFLYIISIIGILCTVYGFVTLANDVPSKEICQEGGEIIMCPVCDLYCDFTYLNSSCTYSKITYVFDNWATIFFVGLMSIWATLFVECWKRYYAELAYKWNVNDLEYEEVIMRPEFQFGVKKKRINPFTLENESWMPFFEKYMRFIGSSFIVFFLICLVVAFAIGIIAYRVIIKSVFFEYDHSSNSQWLQWKVIVLTSITAASINLVFILVMNYFYNWLAYKLTDWECPRTQREFDNSYTLKVFAFQFVNHYSSLFYIAFFKGRFLGVPGQQLEQCDPAGCMVELVIQLFIIMVGKQFFNNFVEIGYPLFALLVVATVCIIFSICRSVFRQWKLKMPKTKQHELDYALNPVYERFLFDEYLEMVIQFGFVTLFVPAFPLAPFFALINNIFEIRLDAYKFIVTTQRPMPARAKGIEIWLKILGIMSNLAVLCNAFVIAFTSNFIPKLYYMYSRGTILGYVEYSLSYYDSRDLSFNFNQPHMSNITVCRYRDYRKPPCSLQDVLGVMFLKDCDNSYDYSYDFWVILAYRLGFVLLFVLVVLFVKAIFANIIPDVPTKVMLQLQHERFFF